MSKTTHPLMDKLVQAAALEMAESSHSLAAAFLSRAKKTTPSCFDSIADAERAGWTFDHSAGRWIPSPEEVAKYSAIEDFAASFSDERVDGMTTAAELQDALSSLSRILV